MFEPKYKAAEFAKLTNTSTDSLRDWRRRGVEFGVLPVTSRNPVYCDYDLFEHSVAMKASLYTQKGLLESYQIGRAITPAVLKRLGFEGDSGLGVSTKYVIGNPNHALISFDNDVTYCEDLSRFFQRDAMRDFFAGGCMVFNLDTYVADLKHFIDVVLPARRGPSD